MTTLQIRPAADIIAVDGWRQFGRDGEQFLRTAVNAHRRHHSRFTPDIIYNLVAMAMEKLIMALLLRRGDLADNHTMGDLLQALERHLGPLPELAADFTFLDTFQQICALETYSCRTPTAADLERIIATGVTLRELLAPYLDSGPRPTAAG